MHQSFISLLAELGFSAKEAGVYEALLRRGPSSVRMVATATGINRGTVHEALKELATHGLVSYYEKEKKHFFLAAPPAGLREVVRGRKQKLDATERSLETALPELAALIPTGGAGPTTRLHEGAKGVRMILHEVLAVTGALPPNERLYRVYSALDIRPALYTEFINFTEERIKRSIMVRVLAVGPGGEEPRLAERKVLSREIKLPTYTIIYGDRCAYIALGQNQELYGVVIADKQISATQRLLFDMVWNIPTNQK